MTEIGESKPTLKVIKGGKRAFEKPEGFEVDRAAAASKGLETILKLTDKAEVLAQPVLAGTIKRPSIQEHAAAKKLTDVIQAETTDSSS